MRTKLILAVVATAVLAAAATAVASGSTAGQVKTKKTSLGTILVDSKDHTLYIFMKDKSGKSSCAGPCAANWPPYLTTGKPTAAAGARASLLGTTKRKDGQLQVTYNHHPVYRFKYDTKAGQTKGENVEAFGAEWYAVSPKGVKVEPKSSGGGGYGRGPSGPTGSGGYGGYGGGGGGG